MVTCLVEVLKSECSRIARIHCWVTRRQRGVSLSALTCSTPDPSLGSVKRPSLSLDEGSIDGAAIPSEYESGSRRRRLPDDGDTERLC